MTAHVHHKRIPCQYVVATATKYVGLPHVPVSEPMDCKEASPEIYMWSNELDSDDDNRNSMVFVKIRPLTTVLLCIDALISVMLVLYYDNDTARMCMLLQVIQCCVMMVMIHVLSQHMVALYDAMVMSCTCSIMINCIAEYAILSESHRESHLVLLSHIVIIGITTTLAYPTTLMHSLMSSCVYVIATSSVYVLTSVDVYYIVLHGMMYMCVTVVITMTSVQHIMQLKLYYHYNDYCKSRRDLMVRVYEAVHVPREYFTSILARKDRVASSSLSLPSTVPVTDSLSVELLPFVIVVRCRLLGLSELYACNPHDTVIAAIREFREVSDDMARNIGAIKLPFGCDECSYLVISNARFELGESASSTFATALSLALDMKHRAHVMSSSLRRSRDELFRCIVCVSCGSGVSNILEESGRNDLHHFCFTGDAYTFSTLMLRHVGSKHVAVCRTVALDLMYRAFDYTFMDGQRNEVRPDEGWDHCYVRRGSHTTASRMVVTRSMSNKADSMV